MEKLFAGMFFLIIGALAIVFNNFFGKIAWLGMPSVEELIKGENKERRYYYRARLVRFLGAGFAVVGGILIIGSLFQFTKNTTSVKSASEQTTTEKILQILKQDKQ